MKNTENNFRVFVIFYGPNYKSGQMTWFKTSARDQRTQTKLERILFSAMVTPGNTVATRRHMKRVMLSTDRRDDLPLTVCLPGMLRPRRPDSLSARIARNPDVWFLKTIPSVPTLSTVCTLASRLRYSGTAFIWKREMRDDSLQWTHANII